MIIKPLNAAFFALILGMAVLIYGLFLWLRTGTQRKKRGVLLLLCLLNLIAYFVYKGALSRDAEFLQLSGLSQFSWWSELPLQLCNINLFLIPLGVCSKKRSILGFSFFVAPLGAALALLFPESPFVGYVLWTPRILGYYLTHAMLVVCGLSLATLGFYQPRYRDLGRISLTAVLLAVGAHILNTILRLTVCPHANYFFTYGADSSALQALWKLIPVPLLYVMPGLLVLLLYMGAVCALWNWLEQRRLRHADAECMQGALGR